MGRHWLKCFENELSHVNKKSSFYNKTGAANYKVALLFLKLCDVHFPELKKMNFKKSDNIYTVAEKVLTELGINFIIDVDKQCMYTGEVDELASGYLLQYPLLYLYRYKYIDPLMYGACLDFVDEHIDDDADWMWQHEESPNVFGYAYQTMLNDREMYSQYIKESKKSKDKKVVWLRDLLASTMGWHQAFDLPWQDDPEYLGDVEDLQQYLDYSWYAKFQVVGHWSGWRSSQEEYWYNERVGNCEITHIVASRTVYNIDGSSSNNEEYVNQYAQFCEDFYDNFKLIAEYGKDGNSVKKFDSIFGEGTSGILR